MDHFYDFSGRLSRKFDQKSSIHQLPALAKFSPRLPGFPAIFWTPNGPIPTLFRPLLQEKHYFFDQGQFSFSMFRRRFFFIFRYFYSSSAPKSGVQSIPRGSALLLVFFSSQTDQFSPNFDHFFGGNRHLATFSFPTCTALAASSNHSAASGASGLSICMHIDMNVLKGCNIP